MYPDMECADYFKLIYQNEFGCGHMVKNPSEAEASIKEEYEAVKADASSLTPKLRTEAIGNGLCRVHLDFEKATTEFLPLLGRLFVSTANTHAGNMASFRKKLDLLCELSAQNRLPLEPSILHSSLRAYIGAGCPAMHHSDTYRVNYRPHYRVIKSAYIPFLAAFEAVQALIGTGAIIAIDGRCGSGKTLLSGLLSEVFECEILHMDDFFLPSRLRTKERLSQPGGNVDYERFRDEVLTPLTEGKDIFYRPYDCKTDTFKPEIRISQSPVYIIEGSYSLHPYLTDSYSLRIFLTCSPKAQLERILKRDGEKLLHRFTEEWIPMEERYFEALDTAGQCGLIIDTSKIHFSLEKLDNYHAIW